ncbi:hypothetical protein K469DRAFT_693960 [Zopfia rhizophila CBS 207.26]|uniref:AMP-dependent synthetase/ligase domain-containing protein n=1 Tax=Zopfia rhizophila CBS 207.26 TaxID=1314779 RepID=A0A6A6DJD7_9PEZI|nr:hypothetical protein K469DRAFT_693960 [Zopfia rhizophila CBS 207.26]
MVREGKAVVVAYLGTADIQYLILLIALTKCGYKCKQLNLLQTLLLSDVSSVDVRVHVTKEAGCDILVCTQKSKDDEALSQRTMQRVIFPELDELAEPPNAKHYPYEKIPEEGLTTRSSYCTHLTLDPQNAQKAVEAEMGYIQRSDDALAS